MSNYSFDFEHQNIVDSMFLALTTFKYPDKCAIKASNQWLSYQQLQHRVFNLAKRIQDIKPSRISILGMRSIDVYEFLLASLVSKITYLPLNPRFLEDKNAFIIQHSESDLLIICDKQADYAKRLLLCASDPATLKNLKILCTKEAFNTITSNFDDSDVVFKEFVHSDLAQLDMLKAKITDNIKTLLELNQQNKIFFLEHEECFADNSEPVKDDCSQTIKDNAQEIISSYQLNNVDSEAIMHILYTSGTTGDPKGVMVTYGNFSAYFVKILGLYGFTEDDIFANCPALTFDISLQDLVCALHKGATVVCPTDLELLNIVKFIDKNHISIINVVPYVINLVDRMHLVKKPTANTLRISIFAGEALWRKQVSLWHRWYPKSKIYNGYGPTEATVLATLYEVPQKTLDYYDSLDSSNDDLDNSITPIGEALHHVKLFILDDDLNPVDLNEEGMLYIAGEQLTKGYFKSPNKQKEAFIEYNSIPVYKSGDYVKTTFDEDSQKIVINYVGRKDDMVKINGVRISVYEIDEELSKLTSNKILSLVYEEANQHVKHVFAVVEGVSDEESNAIFADAKQKLKNYIRPLFIFRCDAFPLNANGKVDRKKLHAMFEQESKKYY